MIARSNRRPWLFVGLATAALSLAILGFLPSYLLPVSRGVFFDSALLHFHALCLFSWLALFATQTFLITRNKVAMHRALGRLGVVIMAALTISIIAVVALRLQQAALPAQPPELLGEVEAFSWVSIALLIFIVPTFAIAIANTPRPDIHKRLMLLITIAILGPAVARLGRLATLGLDTPDIAPSALPQVAVPPVSAVVMPYILADLLILVAMAFDWRTNGKVHPAYWIGGAVLLAIHVTLEPISQSAAWHWILDVIRR